MRASEFLNEEKIGKIGNRKQIATKGLHKFRDEDCSDRVYELNRIMMAVATTDGTFVPNLDGESWAGRYNVAAPYTKEEQNMLMMAYKAVGSEFHDLNKGDLSSKELDGVNTQSAVKPFKGYKRK
jgi:hypothetical protein